jgi:hypothetical protein
MNRIHEFVKQKRAQSRDFQQDCGAYISVGCALRFVDTVCINQRLRVLLYMRRESRSALPRLSGLAVVQMHQRWFGTRAPEGNGVRIFNVLEIKKNGRALA